MQQVWTFIIIGGKPFGLRIPSNPLLTHPGIPGKLTMWKMVGTQEEADQVREGLKQYEVTVTVYSDVQNEEQTRIRQERLGKGMTYYGDI